MNKENNINDEIVFSRKAACLAKDPFKKGIKDNILKLGQRCYIEGYTEKKEKVKRSVTCVDIRDNVYTFSFDNVYIMGYYSEIPQILKEICTDGTINGKIVIPYYLLENIELIFLPDRYQIVGGKGYEEKQFQYYKKEKKSVKIKGFKKEGFDDNYFYIGSCNWFIKQTNDIKESIDFVNYVGDLVTTSDEEDMKEKMGIPIFFTINKDLLE